LANFLAIPAALIGYGVAGRTVSSAAAKSSAVIPTSSA